MLLHQAFQYLFTNLVQKLLNTVIFIISHSTPLICIHYDYHFLTVNMVYKIFSVTNPAQGNVNDSKNYFKLGHIPGIKFWNI